MTNIILAGHELDAADRLTYRLEHEAYVNPVQMVGGMVSKAERVENARHRREAAEQVTQIFEADLAASFGITDKPYAHALFEQAWSDGHAFGYNEVANRYEELYDRFAAFFA